MRGAAGILVVLALSVLSIVTRRYLGDILGISDGLAQRPLALAMAGLLAVMTLALMLPLSPSSPILAASILVVGPLPTFVVGFVAGCLAAVAKYKIGNLAKNDLKRVLSSRAPQFMRLMETRTHMFWVVAVLHMIPNPAYDSLGYVAGVLGIPFHLYFGGAAFGGAVLLSVFCFAGPVLLG